MNALWLIIRRSAVNRFKELLKKPAKLALYVLVFAALVGFIALSVFTTVEVYEPSPIFWFTGILFAFAAFFTGASLIQGVSNGDAIFLMSDVNLLFVSPVNPRKVLLYGLLKMAKGALLATLFVLVQSATFANFGVGFGGVLLTFFTLMVSVIVMSIVSLVVYNATNGNARRKLAVKLGGAALFLPFAVFFALRLLETGDPLAALGLAVQSPFLAFVPIAGWTAFGTTALIIGEIGMGVLFLGANILLGAGLVVYIILSKPDYYEDTLVATETAFEIARGNAVNNKKTKVAKTGVSGYGANALFYKHLRESFRENRFGFFSMFSVLSIIGAAVFAYFGSELMLLLQIFMWIQLFLIAMGRGLKETYTHYIYMIPASSFSKIIWSNMEGMFRAFAEGVLIFGIAGAVARADILIILGCIAVYTLFALLLLGVNYLSMRFTGANLTNGILMMIYLVAVIIVLAPGLVLAIIAGHHFGAAAGLLVLAAWELAAGLVCFALAKGVLHSCDMPVWIDKRG